MVWADVAVGGVGNPDGLSAGRAGIEQQRTAVVLGLAVEGDRSTGSSSTRSGEGGVDDLRAAWALGAIEQADGVEPMEER